MSNYPAGAENDPKAPYNRPDPEYVDCEECNGKGFIIVIEDGDQWESDCCYCNGVGQVEEDEC